MRSGRTMARERPLWKTLALWMLPTLLFLMTASLLLTVQSLRDVADSAYDRSLRGAIRGSSTGRRGSPAPMSRASTS